jgi:hypothetical protein
MAILNKCRITEISCVDKPASEHCRAILKRDTSTMNIYFAKQAPSIDAVELKKRYDAGDFDVMTKADWGVLIDNEAEKSRKPGESFEKAYTRLITEDPAGREAFRAFQSCGDRTMYKQVFGKVALEGDAPQDFVGPAHREMHSLAVDRQRSIGRSYASAYAHVYSHPDNEKLRERVRSEHLASMTKVIHG